MSFFSFLKQKATVIQRKVPTLLMIYRSDIFTPNRILVLLSLKPGTSVKKITNDYDHVFFEYLFKKDDEKVYVFYDGIEYKVRISKKSSKSQQHSVETVAHMKAAEGWTGQISKSFR